MYYAIELFNKHDIMVKDVNDRLMDEILEELRLYPDKLKINTPDGVILTDHKMSTYYLRDKDKRRKILSKLLSSDDCFDNDSFVMNAISSNENFKSF